MLDVLRVRGLAGPAAGHFGPVFPETSRIVALPSTLRVFTFAWRSVTSPLGPTCVV